MNNVAGYPAPEGAVSHGGGKAAQRGPSFSRHGRRNLPTSSGGRKEEGRIASIGPTACVPPTMKAATPIREAFSTPQLLAACRKRGLASRRTPRKPREGHRAANTWQGGQNCPLRARQYKDTARVSVPCFNTFFGQAARAYLSTLLKKPGPRAVQRAVWPEVLGPRRKRIPATYGYSAR